MFGACLFLAALTAYCEVAALAEDAAAFVIRSNTSEISVAGVVAVTSANSTTARKPAQCSDLQRWFLQSSNRNLGQCD